MPLSRRAWVVSALGAAAVVPLWRLFDRKPAAPPRASLVRHSSGILDLPQGFEVDVLERAGGMMSDGLRVPGRADGMGVFAGKDGNLVLMRNHELDRGLVGSAFEGRTPLREVYDKSVGGGVSRLVLSPSLARVSSNAVLGGTLRNCAGGVSPWGWLSCEESVEPGHGFVFLCDHEATQLLPAKPIVAYGRCNHEAVCINPQTNTAYLTEDRPDSCLYRFVPKTKDTPFEGTLQALRVVGQARRDLSVGLKAGESLAIEWVNLPNPNAQDDTLRLQAQAEGAAILRRGEGIIFDSGVVYIVSTSGGPRQAGQVFSLRDSSPAKLTLLAQAEDMNALEAPDNICVAPFGDVIVAEDGKGEQYIRGITPEGKLYDIARNALSSSEFAGVCWAPDGKTLFVNIQEDGLTLALRGPFESLRG